MLPHRRLSEIVFAVALGAALLLALRFRREVVRTVRTYFAEPGSAYNLAVFRIVFYASALALADVPPTTAERFAALPRALLVSPTGFRLVAAHFPISVTLVRVAFAVAIAASVLAAIGLYTRVASVVFLVAVTYYLTIPQIYGKVVHYHTIVWVGAILAASRTADVMSVDAVIRARRRAGREPVAAPAPDTAYSRPIRLTWLLLAVSYLGPGLWKYRTAGLDWISAGNMRAILYDKWYELGGYRPFVPVDRVGFLLTLGALATIAFEIGFILLIWNRRTRVLAAVGGVLFHNMTNLTLHIGFYWAQMLYVSFVDWERLTRWALRRREPLVFAFDGGCGMCRSTAAALTRTALPGGVEVVAAQQLAAAGRLPPGLALEALLTDVHLLTPRGAYRGLRAYRRLAWRLPPLWAALPFLYLPPVASAGERAYRRVADHRLCHVARAEQDVPGRPPRRAWTTVPSAVGAVVVALVLAAIAAGRANAWPFALYPTFGGIHVPESNRLSVVVRVPGAADGSAVSLQSCFRWMPTDRYFGLVRNTVRRARAGRPEIVRDLVAAGARDCPRLDEPGSSFSFYNERVQTTPGRVGRLVRRTLLLRWAEPG